MSVSIDFTQKEIDTVKTFAAALGLTVTEYIKQLTLEQIENALDLQELREAKAESEADPGFVTMEEIAKKYGFH